MASLPVGNYIDESPLPASIYNNLPHPEDVGVKHQAERDELLNLISDHGLATTFSLHMVHKHYDCPEGYIMVYETVCSKGIEPFRICCPRKINKMAAVRGKYFFARPDGTMAAYEYTMDTLPAVATHEKFIASFSQTVLRLGMERVFALTIGAPSKGDPIYEIEMPDLKATLAIKGYEWLPPTGISDDWQHDNTLRGIRGASIREVTSGGRHMRGKQKHMAIGVGDPDNDSTGNESSLTLNDMPLSPSSEAYGLITNARRCIAAA